MARSRPWLSRHSDALARWMASSVPSAVGNGNAARASTGRATLHDLERLEQLEHRLAPRGELAVRDGDSEPQPIQRSQALHLDDRAGHGGRDRPPFSE